MATIIYNTGSPYYGGLVTNSDGLPPGGAPGQVLIKASYNDYDTAWATATIDGTVEGGGGTGEPGTGGDIVLDSIAPIRVSGGGSAWTISIDAAGPYNAGSMSAADKRRLDSLPSTISSAPPATARVGDFWWNTEDGTLYIRYQDKDSIQWVPATPAGGGAGQSVYVGAVPPTGAAQGQLWWNTEDGTGYIWYVDGDSGQWAPFTPQGGSGSGKEVFSGIEPPTGAALDTIWFNSVDGVGYILYGDLDSQQWVPLSPQGGGQGQGVYYGDVPPANPLSWSAWYDTTVGNTFLWYDDGNSAQWVPASPQGGQNVDIDEGLYGI